MTSEEYKALSVKEFTEAAKIMTAVIPASMRCAKTIIRFYWKNWKKSLLITREKERILLPVPSRTPARRSVSTVRL